MTTLDQLAVESAPMPFDASPVELMVVQERADRFVCVNAIFPAIAGDMEGGPFGGGRQHLVGHFAHATMGQNALRVLTCSQTRLRFGLRQKIRGF